MFRKNVAALTLRDTKKKLEALESLQKSVESGNTDETELSPLLKGLTKCVQDNNFRVVLHSLNCWRLLSEEFGENCRSHVHELLHGLVTRSGDSREDVRTSVIDTCKFTCVLFFFLALVLPVHEGACRVNLL